MMVNYFNNIQHILHHSVKATTRRRHDRANWPKTKPYGMCKLIGATVLFMNAVPCPAHLLSTPYATWNIGSWFGTQGLWRIKRVHRFIPSIISLSRTRCSLSVQDLLVFGFSWSQKGSCGLNNGYRGPLLRLSCYLRNCFCDRITIK